MANNRETPKVKITVIGDAEIGKTCLLISYRANSSQKIPSIFDAIQFNKTININNIEQPITVKLCDTSAEQEYEQLRIKSYNNCDICLICFDILNLNSLHNISTKWLPEMRHFIDPHSIIVLVGLKCDLRDKWPNQISVQQIKDFQSKHNIPNYIETSALKKINIQKAFDTGIEIFLSSNNRHKESQDFSVTGMEMDSLNTSMNTMVQNHNKQWNQHLHSMGYSQSQNAMMRSRDNTNMTNNTFPMNQSVNSDMSNQNNWNIQITQPQYNGWNVPPPPQQRNGNMYNEPLLTNNLRTPEQEVKKVTNSMMGSISIDYEYSEDDQHKKQKRNCCVVL